jgi:hypothetical protein
MMRRALCVLLLGFTGWNATLSAYEAGCSASQLVHIEKTVSALKDWDGVFSAYQAHRACNKENVVEVWTAYSGAVASLLAEDWSQFGKLSDISRRHPDFRAFVIKHLGDETIPEDVLAKVRDHAEHQCPTEMEHLCTDLAAATK